MKTVSEDGIRMLVAFEGEELKVYRDPVGLPTFGVGHLVTFDERAEFPVGKKITRAVSRQYLRQDLARFEACVNNAVEVPITQNQFDALVSLAFNIGESAFRKSSVLRHLNNRQFERAANAFGAWNKGTVNGKKVVIQGLVKRRATERSVFLTPDEPDSATAQPSGEPVANTDDSKPLDTSTAPSEPLPNTPEINNGTPVQVTTGSRATNWLFSGGAVTAAGTAAWAWITSNANVVAIAVICVTVLILAVIFRKAILDAIRLQIGGDPKQNNVT